MPQYVRSGDQLVRYLPEAVVPLGTHTAAAIDCMRRMSTAKTWDEIAAACLEASNYEKKEKRVFSPFDSRSKRHLEAAGEFITELCGVPSRVDGITIENEWSFGKEQRSKVTFDVASRGWLHSLSKGFRPKPTKVIVHDPATVVFMSDGTKHVIKCHDGDSYDGDLGVLLICLRKCLGNRRFDGYEKAMRLVLKAARKAKSLPAELRAIGKALIMTADALEVENEA